MTGSKTEEADFKFQVGRVEKAEAKTRKVQCLFRPSLYKKIEAKARELGLSVNELIHQVMNGYISKPKGIQ
jgi:predicted HicB family RNase H-like nuclease